MRLFPLSAMLLFSLGGPASALAQAAAGGPAAQPAAAAPPAEPLAPQISVSLRLRAAVLGLTRR